MEDPGLHGGSRTPRRVQDSMEGPGLRGGSRTPWRVQDSMEGPGLHGGSRTSRRVQDSVAELGELKKKALDCVACVRSVIVT